MDSTLTPMLAAIVEQLTSLQAERATLSARVDEIDGEMAFIAKRLGVNADDFRPESTLPRLSATVDKRHVGSMPERVLEILLNAEGPMTRTDVKKVLKADERFAPSINKNENTFYNNVKRYIRTDKIIERDGFLYHPDRAPLPEGSDDPDGKHFSANVSPIRKLDLG